MMKRVEVTTVPVEKTVVVQEKVFTLVLTQPQAAAVAALLGAYQTDAAQPKAREVLDTAGVWHELAKALGLAHTWQEWYPLGDGRRVLAPQAGPKLVLDGQVTA